MALYNQGGATTSTAVPPMQNMFTSQGSGKHLNIWTFPLKTKNFFHLQEFIRLLNRHTYPILQ
jgi:hypothetical protein